MTSRSTRRRLAVGATAASLLALGLVPATAGTSAPVEEGVGSESLQAVLNLQYAKAPGSSGANRGTDIEFAEIGGVEYALAGTYQNGLQIIDISEPEQAEIVSVVDCGVVQGDIQVFERDGRTLVGFTQDDGTAVKSSGCITELISKGFDVLKTRSTGTVILDITDVEDPEAVSFVAVPKGSHNHTINPTGEYLYNSNSDLITSLASGGPSIEIFDIRDLAKPVRLPDLPLLPVPTSLGAESHDITFSADGKRAYSAALSQTVILDTEDPANPEIISTIVDPTINVVHQSDPVTITHPLLGKRDFLVIEDEVAGAIGTGQCPNGGVHVYDVTGPLEANPVKVGYWNIDEVRTTSDTTLGTCTAHVFDLHEEAGIMTIAYYNGGVRVVDISGLVGVALGQGGVGMREVGFRRFENSDTWSAKTNKIKMNGKKAGSFYLYGNDQGRGFDVYEFDAEKATSERQGTWMDAKTAAVELAKRPKIDLSSYELMCMAAGIEI